MDSLKAATNHLEAVQPKATPTYHKQSYARIDPSKSTFNGKGKTVLITAGATGIGFETSRAFAQTGIQRLIIVSRRVEPQEKAQKALAAEFPHLEVQCEQASVTNQPRMTQLLHSIPGGIDVLILSHTAVNDMNVPAAQVTPADIQTSFDTNVVASWHLAREYLRLPAPASGGPKTLLHVSSAAAHITLPGQIGYGPSKIAFSRMLGSYLAGEVDVKQDGVRLFSFHPGALYTETAETLGIPEDAFDWDHILLPAHFAVWLASGEADFLHGRFLWAHWDVEEMMETFPARIEKDPQFLKFGLTM